MTFTRWIYQRHDISTTHHTSYYRIVIDNYTIKFNRKCILLIFKTIISNRNYIRSEQKRQKRILSTHNKELSRFGKWVFPRVSFLVRFLYNSLHVAFTMQNIFILSWNFSLHPFSFSSLTWFGMYNYLTFLNGKIILSKKHLFYTPQYKQH